jgi:rhodanese-related sulfurtransferase
MDFADGDLPYSVMCLDAQMLRVDSFRMAPLADPSMFADAGSDLPVALSFAQVQAWSGHAAARPPLLIDLRSPRRFRRGHIAGSHSIPSGLLLSGEPPEGALILISEAPREAVAVIDALHEAGYHQRLHYLAEGLAGWRDRGLPIEVSSEPRQAGLAGLLLPGLVGTGLILASALLSSLPLLALGLLLLWGIWIDPALPGPSRRQRLT